MGVYKVMITGPQGSGKTTQAEILAKKFNLFLVEAGDILRQKAMEDSDLGRTIKVFLDKGELVDDVIVADLVSKQLQKMDNHNGFIMDGYPRTIASLTLFDPQLEKVFYLDIPDEIAEKRLMVRGRADDNPEDIKERLTLYHQRTQPVLDYYEKLGKLVKINGQKSIEEITADIEGVLKESV